MGADHTLILAWPELPDEKSSMTGSVAAAIQVGYGLTKSGVNDPVVREAALKFLKFYHNKKETMNRFRNGIIVAPILKNYSLPWNIKPLISKR